MAKPWVNMTNPDLHDALTKNKLRIVEQTLKLQGYKIRPTSKTSINLDGGFENIEQQLIDTGIAIKTQHRILAAISTFWHKLFH
jgi:hypothetical protein